MKKRKIVHFDIHVRGRVQGVGFRYSAQNQAIALGINGFVKNLPNGDVYLEIEGSSLASELMLTWCRSGPGTGHVDEIAISEGAVKNYTGFRVNY